MRSKYLDNELASKNIGENKKVDVVIAIILSSRSYQSFDM